MSAQKNRKVFFRVQRKRADNRFRPVYSLLFSTRKDAELALRTFKKGWQTRFKETPVLRIVVCR